MNKMLIGAALLAVLAVVLPALVSRRFDLLRFAWGDFRSRPLAWREMWAGLADERGAVAVTYFLRNGNGLLINGAATPPTAIQASGVYVQKALISFADTDTQALFTHNWGLDVSAPTYFDPEILGIVQVGPAQAGQTWMPCFTFDLTNTNVVKINKLNFLGTGGTYLFGLRRPHSVGQ